MDQLSNSRALSVDASDGPSTLPASRSSSDTSSALDSRSAPRPVDTSARVPATAANIASSTANQSPSTSHQPPPQIIGRRRRLSADSQPEDGAHIAVPAADAVSAAADTTTGRQLKRRRRGGASMSSDGDMAGAFNGSGATQSNGSFAASTAHRDVASSISANGNRKANVVTNGSSNGEKRSASHPLTYFGHNREEVTRILIQALTDMGYQAAADSVGQESGYSLENPTVAAFRSAVLAGSWAEAEDLLNGATAPDEEGEGGNGLVLTAGSDKDIMRFWLRQQKFLELLERGETSRALTILRMDLTPLYQDPAKLRLLSSLLMCSSPEEVMQKASWDGANGQSRRKLLSELSSMIYQCFFRVITRPFMLTHSLIERISPSVMLPENRLAVLLQHVKQSQIDTCLYHTAASSPSLYSDHLCDRRNFPSEIALELGDFGGEIWSVRFSHDGTRLAACGSREHVKIWDTHTFSIVSVLTTGEHADDRSKGICDISWSPDDSMIMVCSFDKHARLWDPNVRRETPFEQCILPHYRRC